MNGSIRNANRVDRAALGATFAAAIFTLCVSTAAMQPAATPLIAAAEVVGLVVDDSSVAASAPCEHATVTAGETQAAASTGRN
jgi:hypothetical protein